MRSGRWIVRLLALAFAAKLAVALWTLDRGFELGDEGYTLLSLNHPSDAPPVFPYYRLLNPTEDAERFGPIGARRLRLAAELLGSAALLAGVLAWARARLFPPASTEVGRAFVALAALGVGISTASRSLTYNDVTNLCAYSAVGALFWMLAQPPGPAGGRGRRLAALAAGVATGLQLGVKFPTALLLPALFATALALLGPVAPRERARLALVYAAGIAAPVALYVALAGGPRALVADLAPVPEIARRSLGYGPFGLALFYAKGELLTAIHAVVLAVVFGATFVLLRRGLSAGVDLALAGSLAVGGLVLAVGVRMLHPFFLLPMLVFLSAFLAFVLVLLCALDRRARRGDRDRSLAPLWLLAALPLVEIAGTDVPVSQRLATHALPLFAALAALSLDLRARAGTVRLHAVLAGVLLALTTAIFVRHQVIAPYGLPSGIAEQREPITGLPGLRVDAATKSFLESVDAQMRTAGFRPGDPVLALDFMPGLVFYLRGRSPGFTLYVVDSPRLNCFNVNRLYRTAPYLILGRPMSIEQSSCITAFAYPGDFRSVGAVPFPYESVYASWGARDFSHVLLLAPR